MRRPRQARTVGFTLVEVLIVLAVVVILALALMSVLSRLRERGSNATCQNNLHQIGLAMQQYVSHSNGLYPTLWGEHGDQWPVAIAPYLANSQVLRCPTHNERLPESNTDYSYNWQQLSARKTPFLGGHESRIIDATRTWLHQDASWQDENGRFVYEFLDSSCQGHQWMTTLHSGGANFLYVDGHVKWVSTDQQRASFCDGDGPSGTVGAPIQNNKYRAMKRA